jgi:hypothetical protein
VDNYGLSGPTRPSGLNSRFKLAEHPRRVTILLLTGSVIAVRLTLFGVFKMLPKKIPEAFNLQLDQSHPPDRTAPTTVNELQS